ncbi:MAG: DNA-binding domain-containing protein [Paludibacter sp.]|nr:DNA-binding domain-containing protein [Paludibacter sp.]
MKKDNEKPKVPEWLLTGVMSLNDIIDIIIANSNYDRETVKTAMIEFQKVLYERLKEGYSVKSAFGSFYPHFDQTDPVTGEKILAVEFVPTEDMLKKIEEQKILRLDNISLN